LRRKRLATLQYPRAIVPHGYYSRARGRNPMARAVRGAENAGRGALPTTGKREGFSF
jgi:hypothetical protein